MTATIENIGPCRKKLRVEVDAIRVAGVRAEILQEFRKAATLPGFRPGKAPEPMVEKRYGTDIDDELKKRLIPDTYREAISEHKLKIVGYPQVESVDFTAGKPLVFTATVDTVPDFTLPDYKRIPVKKKEVPVVDDDVTKTLDALRDQQAEFVAVEGRGLKIGDFVVINYTGVADGKPIAELAPDAKTLGEHKDFWLLVSSESFLPGFCDQLLGAQAGEKRQVMVDFPGDFPQKPLAGKKATYFVDVTAIKEKKLPAADDDFAKNVGVDSLDKLKAEIRKSLEVEHEAEATGDLRRQVIEYLLAQVHFDLPESLVAQETRSIVYDLVRENSMRGVSKEQLEQKKDEIFGYAAKSAQDRVRLSFIVDAIAQAEKLVVEPAEVDQRIAVMAQRYRTTHGKLKSELEAKGGLGEVEEQLLMGKTLDFLVANANVERGSQPAS